MTISKASELVRALGVGIEQPNLDFADLTLSMVVDGEPVVAEYLPNAEAFVIFATVREADPGDAALLRAVTDLAHHFAMSGGATLTVDTKARKIMLSVRLDLDGLTPTRLGAWLGHVANEMRFVRRALGAAPAAPPAQEAEPGMIRA